jgi:hypothetical protein
LTIVTTDTGTESEMALRTAEKTEAGSLIRS